MAAPEHCCPNRGFLQLPRLYSLNWSRGGTAFLSLPWKSLHHNAINSTRLLLQSCAIRAQASFPGAMKPANAVAAARAVSSVDILEAAGNGTEGGNAQTHLVLMRHGESMWNDLNLFTGDVDIPLTENGVMEALAGGKAVSEIDFDIIFTSRLVRSKQTALIAMTQSKYKRVPVLVRGGYYGKGKTGDENRLRLRDAAANALEHASCQMVPVYADPALNERCYGDLQGLSKDAANKEFGEEVVLTWRRSHDTRPPNGESLQDTHRRTTLFFQQTIEARLNEGKNVLVVAHGNVLRCIISYLSGLSVGEMLSLQVHFAWHCQVVTALPYAYVYNGESFARVCLLPPKNSNKIQSVTDCNRVSSSALIRGEIDSLI